MSQTTSDHTAAPAAAITPLPQIHSRLPIMKDLLGPLGELFDCMEWAEDEIKVAQSQHQGAAADRVFHAFSLLTPHHDRMSTEFVYRSHCRELLGRVTRGEDTRPGTAAEACCAMLETSLRAPLRSSAAGLYMRMWTLAGFPEIEGFTEAGWHHEALEKAVIDEHEQFIRRKLAVEDRRLAADLTCKGQHHGEAVICVYNRPEQLTLDG